MVVLSAQEPSLCQEGCATPLVCVTLMAAKLLLLNPSFSSELISAGKIHFSVHKKNTTGRPCSIARGHYVLKAIRLSHVPATTIWSGGWDSTDFITVHIPQHSGDFLTCYPGCWLVTGWDSLQLFQFFLMSRGNEDHHNCSISLKVPKFAPNVQNVFTLMTPAFAPLPHCNTRPVIPATSSWRRKLLHVFKATRGN